VQTKRCAACRITFKPHPQIPNQAFCSAPDCQRERRRRWQRDKIASDPDHRANQARAQKAWSQRNRDYWSAYRETHPNYEESNRQKQRDRNAARLRKAMVAVIANTDVPTKETSFPSGLYRLKRSRPGEIAKIDEWIVEIISISKD
jgi:hypothetical protein